MMALAYSEFPRIVELLAFVYVALFFVRSFMISKRIKTRDKRDKEIILRMLHYMNDKLFGRNSEHRLTLFVVDDVHKDYISPYVRFSIGGIDGVKDAEESNAHYTKGCGYTGIAWKQPSKCHVTVFPDFKTREEFEYYYLTKLSIPKEVVSNISDYMVKTKQIFCYGLVDSKDQFLGVLSIDSPIIWQPSTMTFLTEMLGLIRTVLEPIIRR